MPAPPARSFSARVPCGVRTTSSSPARYCRANSLFSPTYELTVRRILPSRRRIPRPQSSTPQLLLTVSRSLVPWRCRASMSATGIPHSPKPPTARDAPSDMSATASSALATTLSIIVDPFGVSTDFRQTRPPGLLQPQFPGDQHQLDLRGTLPDLQDLGVPVVARHGELVDEAIAAEYLGGIPRIVHGRLACDHLSYGRLRLERLAGQHPCGRVVVGQAGRVRPRFHPGDLERNGLVLADFVTERPALAGVFDGQVNAALGGAGGQCGDGD